MIGPHPDRGERTCSGKARPQKHSDQKEDHMEDRMIEEAFMKGVEAQRKLKSLPLPATPVHYRFEMILVLSLLLMCFLGPAMVFHIMGETIQTVMISIAFLAVAILVMLLWLLKTIKIQETATEERNQAFIQKSLRDAVASTRVPAEADHT